ncbi:hypothetical protein ANN_11072 [Periplaneta americana]|uniref:Uncharacterized protein n=1 Tax=Periplaneta americana TaxID=6978 RepID=A0ABQ8T3Z5_PERAM|nr:hypothetical protein ANN_11072 [Periplaneta americana]
MNRKRKKEGKKEISKERGKGRRKERSKGGKKFSINGNFLETHPSEWKSNEHFQRGLHSAKGLKDINDAAESGVKMMTGYNNMLTTKGEKYSSSCKLCRISAPISKSNLPARAIPGRTMDNNRCRHCDSETETLPHFLGSCPHGEALRIPDNTKRLRWAGHVARMGESRNAYRVLVGKSEGKRPLGRQRCRCEDNIKMDLRDVGYDDRDWINLAQDRDQWRVYVRAAMNIRVP